MFDALLSPFTTAVAAILAAAQHIVSQLGADAGTSWSLAIVILVVTVRLALVPAAARQVRSAHANATAHPHLAKIRRRYQGKTDQASLLKRLEEERAIRREHGLTGLAAWLPIALQLPVMSSLYFVLRDLAAGSPVGAIGVELAQNAAAATFHGIHLANTLSAVGVSGPGVTIATLLALTAVVTYATQRLLVQPNLHRSAFEGPAAQVQSIMPAVSALGVIVGGAVLPAGVVLYWLVNALWTAGQQAVINRFWPTPGSLAGPVVR